MLDEPGSEKMVAFAGSVGEREMIVSALCSVESASAIAPLLKGRSILEDEARKASDMVARSIGNMTVQPIPLEILENAAALAAKRYLRALDAVQLASAVASREQSGTSDLQIITSDKELLEAAQKEGFTTWNPCDRPSSGGNR